MAKDGTNRGGLRLGAGRKAKPLAKKVIEGKAKKSNIPDNSNAEIPENPITATFSASENQTQKSKKSNNSKAKSVKKSAAKGNKSSADTAELEPIALIGLDMPPLKEYLTAAQKDGTELITKQVFAETWQWLSMCGCEQLISMQLIEQYAMSVARWVQCEECISRYGLLGKHPTTGNDIASPYVTMAQTYMKQVNQAWYQIFQIVRENSTMQRAGQNPQDALMEKLLLSRSGK